MKKLIPIIAFTFVSLLTSQAAEKGQAGPRNGRLLTLDGQKAEFLIEPDRTVSIAFYTDALTKVTATGQTVTATAEAPLGKTKLEFKVKEGMLVSTAPLPEGSGYTIVIQIRESAEAKPKNFRITFQIHACGECKLPEYACICGH